MKTPEIPQNEQLRLQALRSLNLLDTDSEERFDRLTRLARRMFDVPIALVSLVDENRQWFKSCFGLNVSETPRDISFCGHAILGNGVFLIPDTAQDERFSDNPLVLNEPFIRFYAGCPLKYMDGNMLGTLCIIDTKPRNLNEDDLEALKDLAELAEHELMALQLATMDELTRISNRRGFTMLAKHSLDLCARQKIPASLIFIDIDQFKPINDKYGHAEGDAALIAFSRELKKTFRESDVIARLGGDEFAILVTNTSLETAEKTIARLRDSLDKHNSESNRGYDISFSEGIVAVDYDGGYSIESLLESADKLMYDNKSGI